MKRIAQILACITIFTSACNSCSNNSAVPADTSPTDEHATNLSEMEHKAFVQSDENMLNPERGMYEWVKMTEQEEFKGTRNKGFTLVYTPVIIKDYINKDLDQTFLNQLSEHLALARESGVKIIFRFRYSDDDTSTPTDAPLDRIVKHISQLQPIFEANADVILAVEAGFIGRWGEWHSSTNGLDDDPTARKTVINALLSAVSSDRSVLLREPPHKASFVGNNTPLSASNAYSGSASSRIGHHNDCFLDGPDDNGTYPSKEIDFWKDYTAKDTLYVPMGGETCDIKQPRTDCETALTELAMIHWSFLNSEYHEGVLANWTSQGCIETIKKNLGYRFVITDAWWSKGVKQGQDMKVRLAIKNNGYSSPLNKRDIYLVLKGATEIITKIDTDIRKWEPEKSQTIDTTIKIPAGAQAGTYKLSLWLPDPYATLKNNPLYSVRLASDDVWDQTNGTNNISDIIILTYE